VTAEVVLTGELDISTFDKAQKQMEAAEQEAPELLIIDLTRRMGCVEFLAPTTATEPGRRFTTR
jgi:hypothetical protein